MNLKKCQFDSITPCQNKGDICLRTCEERAKYNKVVDEMIEKLKTLKLPLEDSNVPLPNNFVGCGEVSGAYHKIDVKVHHVEYNKTAYADNKRNVYH